MEVIDGVASFYSFSSCYGHRSNQEDIFVTDVKPLVDVVYSGATATIFAYGVTSSGKTHTMQGTRAQPGVIPRAVKVGSRCFGYISGTFKN